MAITKRNKDFDIETSKKKWQSLDFPVTARVPTSDMGAFSGCGIKLEGLIQLLDTFWLFVCKCYWKTEFSLSQCRSLVSHLN